MSFGNATIFPFPAVQYIPLAITDLQTGRIPRAGNKNDQLQLLAGTDLSEWHRTLIAEYGLSFPETFTQGTLPLLGIHLQVQSAKYRGYFLTLLGRVRPGFYQLFTIPTERLYKPKLYVELFDQNNGKLLARYSFFQAVPHTTFLPATTQDHLVTPVSGCRSMFPGKSV